MSDSILPESDAAWLWRHRNADEMVCHAATGRPIKAVYWTHGMPRRYPVEFDRDNEGTNLIAADRVFPPLPGGVV